MSKGWTQQEAQQRVSLRSFRAREMRSQRQETVALDPLWGEWVIVTDHRDGRPVEINRKPRQGLRVTYRVQPKPVISFVALQEPDVRRQEEVEALWEDIRS